MSKHYESIVRDIKHGLLLQGVEVEENSTLDSLIRAISNSMAQQAIEFLPITIRIGVDGNTTTVQPCSHSWKSYEGFNESFEYCIHCDEKKAK